MEKKWKYELKMSTMGVNCQFYIIIMVAHTIYFLAILRLSKRKCDFVFPSKNLSFGLIQEVKKYQYMFSQEKKYAFVFPSKKYILGLFLQVKNFMQLLFEAKENVFLFSK